MAKRKIPNPDKSGSKRANIKWPPVLNAAVEILSGYDTRVTLRQLFYRLVSAEVLPNTQRCYKDLSEYSAVARRAGWFPPLMDRTRQVHEYQTFEGAGDARSWLVSIYRIDRMRNQERAIFLGVEKAGIIAQLQEWFGDLGIPVIALGGYASQTYTDEVRERIEGDERASVLLYSGDYDPSGEDIDRDFLSRTDCFDEVVRVALLPEQVEEFDLPKLPGNEKDARAKAFKARHGELVQVELDALEPETLRALFQTAIDGYVDKSAFEDALAEEESGRDELKNGEGGDA